ncbi:MAG: MFS transporter, partial [Succinivibrio sp.]
LFATFIGIRLIDVLGRKTLLLIGCVGYILSLGICSFSFFNYDELKVVSVSMDTASGADQIVRMENGEVFYTDDDLVKAKASFEDAKTKLKNLAADQNIIPSEGLAVFDGNDVTVIKKVALELKHQASDSLGNVSATVLICMIAFIASHAIGSGTIIWVFISEIFPNEFRAKGQALGSFTHWIFAAGLTLVFPIAIATFDAGFMFGFFTLMMILQLVFALIMMPETKGRSLEEIAKALSST